MANIKFTEQTATTTLPETAILPVVLDPTGTPLNRKITVKDFKNSRLLASVVPASNFSLTAGTAVQSAFPTSGDVITVEGSSTYMFRGKYFITKSGSSTTVALAFALGGGATITSMKYTALSSNIAKNTASSTIATAWVDQVASTVVTVTGTTDMYVEFEGIIRMNAGGTITPQIQFSAAPTSPVMVADSFIWFEKIGTNTENTIGSVA